MSLITEALKRAQNPTDQQPPVQSPSPINPPQAENRFVEMPQERNQRLRGSLLAIMILVAVLVVAASVTGARIWLLRKAPQERTSIPVAAKAAADTPAKPQVAVSK
ncbi:MAG: hypothetical protein ABSC38_02485, partial [Verrucomicrobiia bacterium]